MAPASSKFPMTLVPTSLLGAIAREDGPAPIPGATWYVAQNIGDGFDYRFPAGALAGAKYLATDALVDGIHMMAMTITLKEGENGPEFGFQWKFLNQCSSRVRIPTTIVNQNRWELRREGGWLKPICYGARVDLRNVDRMTCTVYRKTEIPLRWCMTPWVATADEVEPLKEPILPKGALLDELGQSRIHEWPAKSRSPEEVTERLHGQLSAAPAKSWPQEFSRWGGWKNVAWEASGFFRKHHDGRRWWLVDPDGHPFWSAGPCNVRLDTATCLTGMESALTWKPDPNGPYAPIYSGTRAEPGGRTMINYLPANLIRAFGPSDWYEKWAALTLGNLREIGFNSFGNWSDWKVASEAGFPYVRALHPRAGKTPTVFRDFPDVFDPMFKHEAAAFGDDLRETEHDPAMIGYFMMNEPSWGFAQDTLAGGMLFNTTGGPCRRALADFLKGRYKSEESLRAAWGIAVTLAALAEDKWETRLSEKAESDLADFSTVMAERFFRSLSDACRAKDKNHMNLGIRFHRLPPPWALEAMTSFDVFSMNRYGDRIPAANFAAISERVKAPILVGEWHFGALDVGLPASGIGRVPNQEQRGMAYRIYLEYAASVPCCVGAHWYTLYDESAAGRSDGEDYNIGFQDVCNRSYEPLAAAARLTHERLYRLAAGELAPYDKEPQYLTKIF